MLLELVAPGFILCFFGLSAATVGVLKFAFGDAFTPTGQLAAFSAFSILYILIQFSIRFPSAVSTEVFISFLGIGVQGEPSWGVMINNARLRLWQGVWWEMTFTTAAIFVLVLVFNRLADDLRDRLDPALRSER